MKRTKTRHMLVFFASLSAVPRSRLLQFKNFLCRSDLAALWRQNLTENTDGDRNEESGFVSNGAGIGLGVGHGGGYAGQGRRTTPTAI